MTGLPPLSPFNPEKVFRKVIDQPAFTLKRVPPPGFAQGGETVPELLFRYLFLAVSYVPAGPLKLGWGVKDKNYKPDFKPATDPLNPLFYL